MFDLITSVVKWFFIISLFTKITEIFLGPHSGQNDTKTHLSLALDCKSNSIIIIVIYIKLAKQYTIAVPVQQLKPLTGIKPVCKINKNCIRPFWKLCSNTGGGVVPM